MATPKPSFTLTGTGEPLSLSSGQVGIFWFVGELGGSLVHDGVSIDAAEDYGDFKTYDGAHYEFWEALRASGPAAIKARGLPGLVAYHEYEDFPRGRIVYDVPSEMFTIYIDQKLNDRQHLEQIKDAFGLENASCEVLFDHHYQSTETIA